MLGANTSTEVSAGTCGAGTRGHRYDVPLLLSPSGRERLRLGNCYGACEGFWPPLIAKGEPQPSNGTDASLLGTTERKDGKMQVTYAGHPLYTFVEDTAPGEANGNNLEKFGGEWYALNSKGEEPSTSGGEEESSEESSSGGYSGY